MLPKFFVNELNESYTQNELKNILQHVAKLSGEDYKTVAARVYSYNTDDNGICSFCEHTKKFISITKGYRCINQSCIAKRRLMIDLASDTKLHRIQRYKDFIKENLQYYKDNLSVVDAFDPFHNKHVGNYTLASYMSRMLMKPIGDDSEFNFPAICPYCKRKYKNNIFRELFHCQSKTCTSFSNNYSPDVYIKTDTVANELVSVISRCVTKNTMIDAFKSFDFTECDLSLLRKKIKNIHDDLYVAKRNALCLLNHKDCISKLLWSEYPNICFVTGSHKSIEHFIRYFNLNDVPNEEYYDNKKYFSTCEICGNRNQIMKPFTDRKLSRFCKVECYHTSLSQVEKFHPNINTVDGRNRQSEKIKNKILSGTFTPRQENRHTWKRIDVVLSDGSVIGVRSSWEAIFLIMHQSPSLLYEKVRIPYKLDNETKIYITDFVDTHNKLLYEIKPKKYQGDETFKQKSLAANEWCATNRYTYVIIDEDWMKAVFSTCNIDVMLDGQPEKTDILRKTKQFFKVRCKNGISSS